jgi:hypothetical protein
VVKERVSRVFENAGDFAEKVMTREGTVGGVTEFKKFERQYPIGGCVESQG